MTEATKAAVTWQPIDDLESAVSNMWQALQARDMRLFFDADDELWQLRLVQCCSPAQSVLIGNRISIRSMPGHYFDINHGDVVSEMVPEQKRLEFSQFESNDGVLRVQDLSEEGYNKRTLRRATFARFEKLVASL